MFKFIVLILSLLCTLSVSAKNVDPTKPLSMSASGGSAVVKKGLVLESIIQGKKVKSAIISGKLLKIGDYIGNHKLVSVSRSSVVLRSEDERLKLSIFSGVVVK